MKFVADAYFHRIPFAEHYWKNRTFESGALTQMMDRIDWARASNGKNALDGNPVGHHVRVIKISATGEINFDSKAGEVWIAWHRGIHGLVLDLLRNAVYATAEIGDPWNVALKDRAHLWVRIDYGQRSVDLTLANASGSDSQTLFQKLKTYRWSSLAEIDGSVESVDVGCNVVGIRVRIPYAAYLSS